MCITAYYVCVMFHKLQIQQIDDSNKNSDIPKTIYKNLKPVAAA